MKTSFAVFLYFLATFAAAEPGDCPIIATMRLMDDLKTKLINEAAVATKTAAEYADWCKEKATELGFAIETGESSKEDFEATVSKMTANIHATNSKIDEFIASISADDSDLKAAEAVRAKEKDTFEASEAELAESIEVLSRAFTVMEREMSKNPASLLQVDIRNIETMTKSLAAVIDAAAFPSGDQKKLVALMQAQSVADADDTELGAPAAAVYTTHSTSILDVIEDLREKAEAELSDLQKAEQSATHNFEILKQSLTDSREADSKRLAESKASKASFTESKAFVEGDYAVTVKTLEEDKATKASTEDECAQVAADHEASMKGRSEELAAIAEAKKVLWETTVQAGLKSYAPEELQGFLLKLSPEDVFKAKGISPDFFQVVMNRKASNHAVLANIEIVTAVKKLARQHHSAALAQLASRIVSVFRYGVQTGEDPFTKVKGLVSDLIIKLEQHASEEASEKAFCDEEMAKTDAKKNELNSELASLASKIGTATAKSATLKGEVKELQDELAELAKSHAEATKIRQEAHAEYVEDKTDFENGLTGVRKAMTVLRDYFGGAAFVQQPAAPVSYSKSTGAGTSIIDILEVVESDFAKTLATMEIEETDAAAAYKKAMQESELTKTTKTQDVKYKEKEFKALGKTIVETSADKDTTSTELESVMEYDAKLKERCVAKPETYEAKKARRESEIMGLREALKTLEMETAFMQRSKRAGSGIFLAPF